MLFLELKFRAEITFIVNELCQMIADPDQQGKAKLKRLARYLERERQWARCLSMEGCPKK